MEKPFLFICLALILVPVSSFYSCDLSSFQERRGERLKDAVLWWDIFSSYVDFTLCVSNRVADRYDWYGIALKEPTDQISMIDGDFTVVMFGNKTIRGMNTFSAKSNGRPQNDVRDPVKSEDIFSLDSSFVFAEWYRPISNKSDETIAIKEGKNYTLLYAYGNFDKDSVILKHDSYDIGYGNITLSSNFSGEATVSRKMSKETLKNGILEWRVWKNDIDFQLTIDSSLTKNDYWYGVALKNPSNTISMIDAEYVLISGLGLGEGVYQSLYPMNTRGYTENKRPQPNNLWTISNLSGFFDLAGNLKIGWTQGLYRFFNSTLTLKEGNNYTLLFAYGKKINGTIQKHEGTNRGYGEITLSNDFSGKVTIPPNNDNDNDESIASNLCMILILSVLQLLF